MPRYLFQIHDGRETPDIEGLDLPDIEAARIEAVHLAGDLLQQCAARFTPGTDWRVSVMDPTGLILLPRDVALSPSAALGSDVPVR